MLTLILEVCFDGSADVGFGSFSVGANVGVDVGDGALLLSVFDVGVHCGLDVGVAMGFWSWSRCRRLCLM